ncbi:NAD(P)H-quinone oxidoreductase subunit N [Thalassoporum mexicanum PCC 7367]|uniref:NAD(P)H-quinone oxidoreductase subunit N n=1 Tax=Thalassoporum mexicanum TaxID=3457544 RepID=UPI00029FBDDB|nr:NAD(P)H-quinone oxidoreductase subunit N [Pseudanabaena sp. PCC 7367]AFY71005.1 NAD(P)H-quinone oxidoreductase subunit N [Pseudanabaena sp. PCC 7367]
MPLFTSRKILKDLEKSSALAMSVPPEGGYEGRYRRLLEVSGYDILYISARGLGDISSFLTGVHGVRPAHLGKKDVRTYFIPPEISYRLQSLPKDSKGLVVWLIEGKYLDKQELRVLNQICQQDPRVKVVIEIASDRSVNWRPLSEAIAA